MQYLMYRLANGDVGYAHHSWELVANKTILFGSVVTVAAAINASDVTQAHKLFNQQNPPLTEAINHPAHYQSACETGRRILRAFGFSEDVLSEECDAVMRHVGWTKDAYLYNACKYCWRCEKKASLTDDLKKAQWYLEQWMIDHRSDIMTSPQLKGQVSVALTAIENILNEVV